jgi:hypothetical protein
MGKFQHIDVINPKAGNPEPGRLFAPLRIFHGKDEKGHKNGQRDSVHFLLLSVSSATTP